MLRWLMYSGCPWSCARSRWQCRGADLLAAARLTDQRTAADRHARVSCAASLLQQSGSESKAQSGQLASVIASMDW
jgi:hypothetical protein